MALINCDECGKEVSDKASACPSCGAPIGGTVSHQQPIIITAPKSRSLAALLALFLGGIGIHKFYLNSPGIGFLYLIFCWTFIPAIIGLIEGLNFIFMSDKTFQERYTNPQRDWKKL